MALGEQLRTARLNLKMTTSQIASATCMKVQIVDAIEEENFSKIPAPIYAKGFIRLFAEQVGVDPVPLIREYISNYVEKAQPEPEPYTPPKFNQKVAAEPEEEFQPPSLRTEDLEISFPPVEESEEQEQEEDEDEDYDEDDIDQITEDNEVEDDEEIEEDDEDDEWEDEEDEEDEDGKNDLFTHAASLKKRKVHKEPEPPRDYIGDIAEVLEKVKNFIINEILEPCGELAVKGVETGKVRMGKMKESLISADYPGRIKNSASRLATPAVMKVAGASVAVAVIVILLIFGLTKIINAPSSDPDQPDPAIPEIQEPNPQDTPEILPPTLPPPSPYWD